MRASLVRSRIAVLARHKTTAVKVASVCRRAASSRSMATLHSRASLRCSAAVHTPATRANGFDARRTVFISVTDTPNPDSLKFIPEDTIVLPEEFGGGQMYNTAEDAKGAYIVRRLLKLPGVTGVFLGRDFISVNKKEEVEWMELKPLVFSCIMDALGTGRPLVDYVSDVHGELDDDDDEVVAMIKELLETRIRPAVQEDGGDIFFDSFEDGVLYVRLAGSCQGCPSSTDTLQHGVEAMMQHYIPEVESVQPVEDEELNQVNNEAFQSLEERLAAAGVPQ